jgi:hypothetical protein
MSIATIRIKLARNIARRLPDALAAKEPIYDTVKLDPCQPNDALLFTCAVTLGEKLPNETSYRVAVSEVLTRYCEVQNQQNREAGGRLVLISCPEG